MKIVASFLFAFVVLASCARIKSLSLYDKPADDADLPNINGFYSLSIFKDQITAELWNTISPLALNVKPESEEFKSGGGAISLEWNKQADPTTWIGMGIGWDNWSGKNITALNNAAALSFWVKMKKGQSVGLPWAVGFEDFAGGQAWTGVTTDFIAGGIVKDQWTQVIIPLSNFPFEAKDVDMSNIKQVLFQFESSGKAWVDDISFIPHAAKGKPTGIIAKRTGLAPQIDGIVNDSEWQGTPFDLSVGKVYVNTDKDFLYIGATVNDPSPLINNKSGREIWNGDALEIAFSSASGVSEKRTIFYPSDHHIGIKMSKPLGVFDFANDKPLENGIKQMMVANKNGYSAEIAIPWNAFGIIGLTEGATYDFEIAIDLGDEKGERVAQSRWSSGTKEGFNFNPSLWGKATIQP